MIETRLLYFGNVAGHLDLSLRFILMNLYLKLYIYIYVLS